MLLFNYRTDMVRGDNALFLGRNQNAILLLTKLYNGKEDGKF